MIPLNPCIGAPMNEVDYENIDRKFQKELNAGIAALVLLSVLSRSEGALYGYQIAKMVEESQNGGVFIKLGTLYPVLRSLEETELLKSEVEPSVSGPPRRYYRITTAGRATLKRWQLIWGQTREMVEFHMKGNEYDSKY
jgi:PadR family transcriptional regulator, regulatory protein PadR